MLHSCCGCLPRLSCAFGTCLLCHLPFPRYMISLLLCKTSDTPAVGACPIISLPRIVITQHALMQFAVDQDILQCLPGHIPAMDCDISIIVKCPCRGYRIDCCSPCGCTSHTRAVPATSVLSLLLWLSAPFPATTTPAICTCLGQSLLLLPAPACLQCNQARVKLYFII